jgi:hypothetical protein
MVGDASLFHYRHTFPTIPIQKEIGMIRDLIFSFRPDTQSRNFIYVSWVPKSTSKFQDMSVSTPVL